MSKCKQVCVEKFQCTLTNRTCAGVSVRKCTLSFAAKCSKSNKGGKRTWLIKVTRAERRAINLPARVANQVEVNLPEVALEVAEDLKAVAVEARKEAPKGEGAGPALAESQVDPGRVRRSSPYFFARFPVLCWHRVCPTRHCHRLERESGR